MATTTDLFDPGVAEAIRRMGVRDGRYGLAPPLCPRIYQATYDEAYRLGALEADGVLVVADVEPASMCGGCSGSGWIRNPNTGQREPHLVCGGKGAR